MTANPEFHVETLGTGAWAHRRGRENAKEKGLRLLLSGRLRVTKVDGNEIEALCRGDSGQVYRLKHSTNEVPFWECSCPARTACSHLHALWAVTAVER